MNWSGERKAYWTPLLLLIFLLSLFAVTSWYLEKQQVAARVSKARVVAEQIANNLEVFSADRERALVDLMLTWPDFDPNIVDWFNAHAVAMKQILPGIEDIIWADENQLIQWSIDADQRDNLLHQPLAAVGLTQTFRSSDNFSHALVSNDIDRHLVVIGRPIAPESPEYGFIAATFDVSAILSVMVGELVGPQFSFVMLDDKDVLMKSGDLVYDNTIIDTPIDFAQRKWILRMQSQEGTVNLGILVFSLGGLMSLMVCYFLQRQLRSTFKLSQSQARYKAASESSLDAIIIYRPLNGGASVHDFVMMEANQVAEHIFASSQFEFAASSLYQQLQAIGHLEVMTQCQHVADSGEPFETYLKMQGRVIKPQWLKIQVVKADNGIAITVRDVSARFKAENELRVSEAKFRRLVDGLNNHYIYWQNADGKTEFVSSSITDILGYEPEYFRQNYQRHNLSRPANYDSIKQLLRQGGRPEPYREEYEHRNGEKKIIEFSDSPVMDEDGVFVGVEGIGRDVTEDVALQDRVYYQANHDQLTGLHNRYAFDRMLGQTLEDVKRRKGQGVLCFIDMDKFKLVNDTSGHPAGDELLRQVAELLRRNLRQRDVLARVGGDEFCMIFTDSSVEQVRRYLERLLSEISEFRFVWQDRLFFIGASIGMVEITEDAQSPSELVKAADSACYRAKGLGSNRYFVYEEDEQSLEIKDTERESVNQIQHALKHDQLELFFQPIVPLNARTDGVHYEVLLRLCNDNGEYLSPAIFIPVAERYGLMGKIDAWVFEHTLRLLEGSPEHLDQLGKCAINLSGLSLNDDQLLQKIIDRLTRSIVPPEKLCFEITETAAVTNLASANRFIDSLRSLGCKFALDDFGAGMCSFTYLKNMQVDFVKIDGSFVRNMCRDKSDFATVKAVHEIASSMGKQTIAEFVADSEIEQALTALGIDYAQGFALGKPSPLEGMLKNAAGDAQKLRVL